MRTNPQGRALRALAPHPWLRPLLQRGARHRHRQVPRRPTRPGEPRPEPIAEPRGARRRRSDARHEPASASPASGRIDRDKPVRFTFDGKAYDGPRRRHARLGAARQRRPPRRPLVQVPPAARHPVGRRGGAERARRHRPRRRPLRAEHARHGRRSSTTASRRTARTAGRRSPSTSARSTTASSQLFSAGFYYKTFMWPKRFWNKVYEPSSAAPPASASRPTEPDPDRYASRFAHCDVLVVGAGPAGLAAALAAAAAGAKVILVDEQAELGGCAALRARRRRSTASRPGTGSPARSPTLAALPNVTLLPRTTAFGYYHQNLVGLCRAPHRPSRRRCRPARRASGCGRCAPSRSCSPRAPSSGRWSSPATTGPASCWPAPARTYLNRYGVTVGDRAVVVTAHDSAWHAAFDLAEAGVDRRRDRRRARGPSTPALLADGAGASASRPCSAAPSPAPSGRLRVAAVRVNRVEPAARSAPARDIACDARADVAAAGRPRAPLLATARQARLGRGGRRRSCRASRPRTCRSPAPAAAASGSRRRSTDGAAAGAAAARDAGCAAAVAGASPSLRRARRRPASACRELPDRPRPAPRQGLRRLPERRHRQGHPARGARGLPLDRARQALHHHRHGDRPGQDVEHQRPGDRRRRARQGRRPQVGPTTFRPPYTPVTFGAFAGYHRGDLFELDAHDADPRLGRGARRRVRADVGLWQRARYFPRAGEDMHAAVARECRPVRAGVGMFDASTLGKIEVVGPDAAEFMNRMYTNAWTKLEPGRCRYGLMLGEDGFIFDDGVVGRLAPDRFHVTTTTGGAARVLNHMEDYLQTEWPDLEGLAHLDHRAVGGDRGAGPERPRGARAAGRGHRPRPTRRSRTWRCAKARSAACRRGCSACRFTGELGFEVNVPARLRPAPSGRRSARPASTTASRPTAPRPCTCCAPRRATSSSARTPTAR